MGDELPLAEAAARLGLTEAALRKRLQRSKTIRGVKRDGQWYVRLPTDAPQVAHGQDAGSPSPAGGRSSDVSDHSDGPLLDHLRAEVEYLRAEVTRMRDQAAEERRRHDEALAEERRIIAGLMQRLPELAAPSPSSTAPVENAPMPAPAAVAGVPDGPVPAVPGPRKPWWRWRPWAGRRPKRDGPA